MKHGRPIRIYWHTNGMCQYIAVSQDYCRSYGGWRRCHAHRSWQAIVAIIGFAVAWDLGAKYYLVGGKEWVEP